MSGGSRSTGSDCRSKRRRYLTHIAKLSRYKSWGVQVHAWKGADLRGNHKAQLTIADQPITINSSIKAARLKKPIKSGLSICLLLVLLSMVIGSNVCAQELTLAWDPNTEPDLDGYTVYYSKGSPGPPYDYAGDLPLSELADPENPKVTLTELEEQVSYYIALTAYDINGNESSFSSSLCVYIDGAIQECAPASVENNPVVDSSSGGGSSGGGGGCFIATASQNASAVPDRMTGKMTGWYSMLILAGMLLMTALRWHRINSACQVIFYRIAIYVTPKRPFPGG